MAVSDQSVATGTQLDQLCINTIRTLSMDAVQKANSGHPGAPMALAPVAYCLWQQFLRYDPEDPIWPAYAKSVPTARFFRRRRSRSTRLRIFVRSAAKPLAIPNTA